MPLYTKSDVKRTLELEIAIHDEILRQAAGRHAGGSGMQALAATDARISALHALMGQAPDDEAIDDFF